MGIALLKHARIFRQSLRIQLIKIGEYKANFFSDMLIRVFGFLIFIATWQSILGNTQFPGWELKGLLLMFSMQNIFLALIFMLAYGGQSIRFSITSGSLDIYLSRPCHPWFVVLVTNNFLSFGGLLLGFGSLFLATQYYGLSLSPIVFLMILAFLFSATMIALTFNLMLNTLAFWFGKFNLASSLFWALFEFDFYPTNVFPVFLQLLIAFTVPFIFANTVPVLFILQKFTFQQAFAYLLSAVGIFAFNLMLFLMLWNKGVKRYEAVGG